MFARMHPRARSGSYIPRGLKSGSSGDDNLEAATQTIPCVSAREVRGGCPDATDVDLAVCGNPDAGGGERRDQLRRRRSVSLTARQPASHGGTPLSHPGPRRKRKGERGGGAYEAVRPWHPGPWHPGRMPDVSPWHPGTMPDVSTCAIPSGSRTRERPVSAVRVQRPRAVARSGRAYRGGRVSVRPRAAGRRSHGPSSPAPRTRTASRAGRRRRATLPARAVRRRYILRQR
jgi:hypothetical protein